MSINYIRVYPAATTWLLWKGPFDGVVQWKEVGPITQKLMDWNHPLQIIFYWKLSNPNSISNTSRRKGKKWRKLWNNYMYCLGMCEKCMDTHNRKGVNAFLSKPKEAVIVLSAILKPQLTPIRLIHWLDCPVKAAVRFNIHLHLGWFPERKYTPKKYIY